MKTGSKIFFACFLVVPILASAQFSIGDKFVGGVITYNTIGRPDAQFSPTYSNSFSVNPTLGFMVGEGFAVGTRVGFAYSFYEDLDFNLGRYTYESKTYSAGVFLTKYISLGERFWFSFAGGLDYGRRVVDAPFTTTSLQGGEHYMFTLSARPGFVFLPNQRWGITLSIGNLFYNHFHGIGNEVTENEVGATLGPVGLGVLYFFK